MKLEALRSADLDDVTRLTIEACSEVHRRLGPGLSAEVYLEALCHELSARGVAYQRRLRLPVFYRGIRLDEGYQLDVCVAGAVVVDVRCLPAIGPLHRAELRARLRVSGLDTGILVNFHTARFADGLVVLRRAPSPRRRPARELDAFDQPTTQVAVRATGGSPASAGVAALDS